MKFPLYFDHNATTPCEPDVVEAMLPWFTERFGNASSVHYPLGWLAEEAVETAREQLAVLIGASPKEIIFTSGATEAINLAIRGVLEALETRGGHIVTLATEHKAVLDTCKALERRGISTTYLPVGKDGLVDLGALENAIRETTALIAVMLANNETGVLQPVDEIAQIAQQRGIIMLSDAVQAVGKMPLSVQKLGIDLMPLSAHKMYGPKGVGALYISSRLSKSKLVTQVTGGGHEKALRSGTLNVPGIVGFGKAAEIALDRMSDEGHRLAALRDALEDGILSLGGAQLNGNKERRLPHVSNISFEGVEGKAFLIAINKELAISSGSACSSITTRPSHVLTAMGLESELARSTLRFGLGRSNTAAQVDFAIQYVKDTVEKLRKKRLG
ncbi:MAG TPA: cysteine desulfurase family protein [Cyclobacteriaceae bacterium]|nr:cysteine desulfurase family protein [Cyclobacteriaceae bacterium]